MARLRSRLIRGTIVVALSICLLLSTATPVYAISNPDSGPFILQVDAYQNLRTTGDTLFLVRVNVPYADAPSEPASETFTGRLLLADEVVAETVLYAYYNNGYGYNTFALYSSSGITWEAAYTIELSGSPTLDWSGDVPTVSVATIGWHTSSSTALSQALLSGNILDWASSLTGYWSVALLATTAGGSALSSYGISYFTNVVPYLSSLCPAVLPSSQTAITYEDLDFQSAGAATVPSLWPFDFSGISDWLGLPNAAWLHILIAAALIVLVCMSLKFNPKLSIIASFSLLIVLTIPGFLSPVIAAAAIFVAVLGVGLVFVLGKPIA